MEVFGLSRLCRTQNDKCKDVTPICIPDVHVATHNTKPENWNMYSRLPIIQTFRGNRKKFELPGVWIIEGKENILKGNKNCFEWARGSGHRGFEGKKIAYITVIGWKWNFLFYCKCRLVYIWGKKRGMSPFVAGQITCFHILILIFQVILLSSEATSFFWTKNLDF